MKKDIDFTPVTGVQVVIARKKNELDQFDWQVFLINHNKVAITNIFVTSKGYSSKDDTSGDQAQRTSTLRHFFPELQAGEYQVVETITPDVFHLNNEYWVSYFIDGQIFDKKFIFVPDSIVDENLRDVPALGLEGVLHD